MKIINSKCGKYSVEIMENGRNAEYGYMVAAMMNNSFDSETMSNKTYWFTVGTYKTEKNAIRQAVKKMAGYNIELDVA